MNELLRRILFLPPQRSTFARDVDSLHYFVISVTMAGSILVFLVAAILVVRYRRPPHGDIRLNPAAAGHRPLVWFEASALFGLLTLFLVWWVIGSRQFVRIRVPPENTLEVYVTGKQWMWKFAYPDGHRAISELYVPAGRPVKLIMTSRDVIHSFYVPDFRVKQDVLPGRYTTLWFQATEPGRYAILCAEYCGTQHSTMRGEVVVLSPSNYEKWLENKPTPPSVAVAGVFPFPSDETLEPIRANLAREGMRAGAEYGCFRCHTTDGSSHIGPTWAGMYGTVVPLAKGSDVLADEAYITESMMDPLAKVVRGYDPVMPSYFGRIPAAETAAIVELIKSLRDVPRQGPGGTDPGPTNVRNLQP